MFIITYFKAWSNGVKVFNFNVLLLLHIEVIYIYYISYLEDECLLTAPIQGRFRSAFYQLRCNSELKRINTADSRSAHKNNPSVRRE